MDTRTIYIQALLAELEKEILARTLRKVQVITRSMKKEEKDAYLSSQSFKNALNQTRKKDHVFQALTAGTLNPSQEAEFERLEPLIRQVMKQEKPLDLAFLRSVQRMRIPLSSAVRAAECLEKQLPLQFFEANHKDICAGTEKFICSYLKYRLQPPAPQELHDESVVEHVIRTSFHKGVTVDLLNQTVREASFLFFLQKKILRAFPDLASCSSLRLATGLTVMESLKPFLLTEQNAVCHDLKKKFPLLRIRKLLKDNPSVKEMQQSADEQRSRENQLKKALLIAIPEHIPDLFPDARKMKRHFVVHLGPTNSGKTWESIQRLHVSSHGIYLGPLRLLAYEQFENLNMADVPCSLVTGEEQILVPQSRVQSSTIEMADLHVHYDIAVIDEAQMLSDPDRGGAWSAAILGLCANEIHVCASPDAEAILLAMIQDCGDSFEIVRHERMTPLVMDESGFHFPDSVRKGDALIVFSRVRVHALAAELTQLGFHVSLVYGTLPPDVRRDQSERFRRGETDVVVSTDAIAMGMNLPIARVVFMESEKYDGDIVRPLTDSEIRQIAGRAGRYGQYDIGYVNAFGFKQVVFQALNRPFRPVTHAVIRFPESLLGLPLPLTRTIDQWIAVKDKSYFSKASTMRMAGLASRLETRTSDKRLLYDFICIPFDETDPDLFDVWKSMYHAEANHEHFDVFPVLPDYQDPDQCTVSMLNRLEEDYRLCDLLYNYTRRFLENPDRLLETIQLRKDLISEGIIHILSTQKLSMRVCRKCGRRLPWNWPYSICDHCHGHYS